MLILFLLGLFRLSANAQHEHPEDLSKSKEEKTGVQALIPGEFRLISGSTRQFMENK